jgi:hypothetical protein
MRTELSVVQITTSREEHPATAPRNGAVVPQGISALAIRVYGEYREMPGLRLTVRQAARLFSVAFDLADAVLHELRRASILARSNDGAFALIGEPSRERTAMPAVSEASTG